MMDWKVILFILLLVGLIGITWFLTIKDMVKHFHYLKSQKITKRANQDDCDYYPEPYSMSDIEIPDGIVNADYGDYKDCTPNSNIHPCPSNFFTIITHVKHIISRIKRRCNQKQIKPNYSPARKGTLFWLSGALLLG